MSKIVSRKHAAPRIQQMSTVLAALLLPMAGAHAADAAPVAEAAGATTTLQEVRVQGTKENDFKADKAASPKYTELLVNTPQTITVIKRELIEQQGAVTLTEALRNTPGVGTFFLGENGSTNTGDAIYMRGFDASSSIYVDGVRDMGSISRDTFNIEQIDVVKGPAGTDGGRGSPTGSINLTSKQATLESAISSIVTVGSGKQKRATLDVNQVINADKGIAFRVNLLDQDSGNPARDVVKNKRWAIAPTIGFGLNGATRLYLNYLHVDQDNIPDGGVSTVGLPGYTSPDPKRPFIANAAPVDPRNFYGSAQDYDKVKADMVTVRVEHDFAPTVKLQNTSRYGKTRQDYLLSSYMATADNLKTPVANDPSTWTLVRVNTTNGLATNSGRTIKDQDNQILTNQTTVTADLDTGALKHTLVAGLEFIDEKQLSFGYDAMSLGQLAPANLYHPDPYAPVTGLAPKRNSVRSEGNTSTQSLYLFDTVKLGERWMFSGGLRADHFNTSFNAITLVTTNTAATAGKPATSTSVLVPVNLDLSDTLVNGKLSVLFKPTADSSVYATVANSKQPPGGATFTLSTSVSAATNPKFDPQETTTKEIGTKWDFLKQKLALTAAIYRTDIKNEIEVDPTNTAIVYQNGKKRVEGVEIGLVGEIARNWLVSAGYTHMKTSVESGKVVTASGINNLSYTPKDAFTGWTSYSLPFGLKLGGGVRYVGKLLRGTDGAIGTPAFADAYWVADAMASYSVNKHVDLQFNLYNITDKEYIAAINKSGYRYTPGAPRTASVTANLRF
ncbi:MAG: catecholate siderophore receptor Fiu [Pseudomonadota bacterium]